MVKNIHISNTRSSFSVLPTTQCALLLKGLHEGQSLYLKILNFALLYGVFKRNAYHTRRQLCSFITQKHFFRGGANTEILE